MSRRDRFVDAVIVTSVKVILWVLSMAPTARTTSTTVKA